jgi:tRNA 5-methylaminomethyl-2-thiouridine biosynthesis bifunctional protein
VQSKRLTAPGLQSPATQYSPDTRALILGAGVAGCAIARALAHRGYNSVIYERLSAPAAATSAVPHALLRPQVTKAPQITNHYFHRAFERARQEIAQVQAQVDHSSTVADLGGVLQLVNDADSWPDSSHYARLDRSTASSLAGTELAGDALYFEHAGRVNLGNLCRHWLSGLPGQIRFNGGVSVDDLRQTQDGWCLLDQHGDEIDASPLIIIASGETADRLSQTAHLPLQAGRGQISFFNAPETDLPTKIITGKGSVIPANNGFWAGSTHQRGIANTKAHAADDSQNLTTAAALCPHLCSGIRPKAAKSWTGIRYSSPDRMPIVGGAPVHDWYLRTYADLKHGRRDQSFPHPRFHDGLYLLTGFGSRGAIHSVYAAELLAALIAGDTHALDDETKAVCCTLHPGRFLIRQARRGQPAT